MAAATTSAESNSQQQSPSCLRFIDAHKDAILSLALTDRHPTHVLTTSRDQTVKMHDFTTGDLLYSIALDPSWACTCAFSADGQMFVTGSFDNNVVVFRTKDGERVRQIRVFNLGVTAVAFPVGYEHVVCGTSEGHLQLVPL